MELPQHSPRYTGTASRCLLKIKQRTTHSNYESCPASARRGGEDVRTYFIQTGTYFHIPIFENEIARQNQTTLSGASGLWWAQSSAYRLPAACLTAVRAGRLSSRAR